MNRGQIIIYEGDYINRALTANDPIVAFTTTTVQKDITTALGTTGYSLCVYEASAFGRSEESSIGEIILTYYSGTTPNDSYRLAKMTGDAPFSLRLEHVGDAIFVDSNGKFSFDVSGFYKDFDPTSE